MDEETLRVVTAHNTHWAQGNVTGLFALYHPAMVFTDHYSGQRYTADALRTHIRGIIGRSQLDSIRYTDRVRVDGDTAILLYRETIRSATAPTLMSVSACDVVRVSDGLIVSIDEFAIPEPTTWRGLSPSAPAKVADDKSAACIGKVGLSAREIGFLLSDLDGWMQDKRPFLTPHLSLQDLATATGYTRNQISFALNQIRGVSFFDYVNRVRVEHLLRQVPWPESGGVAVWAEQGGFRSLSTFYGAFRAVTGLSPSAWRNALADKG